MSGLYAVMSRLLNNVLPLSAGVGGSRLAGTVSSTQSLDIHSICLVAVSIVRPRRIACMRSLVRDRNKN